MALKFRYFSCITLVVLSLIVVSCDGSSDKPSYFLTDPCEIVKRTPDSLVYFPAYEKPVVISPIHSDNPIFYSEEVVEIKWELAQDLSNTDIQIIELDHPYTCLDYEKFHFLKNIPSAGYGNQYVHYFQLNQFNGIITDSVFVAYRIRAADIAFRKGYSLWTDVKTFTVAPLANMKKDVVTVTYNFNFVTEEVNRFYYSGILKKDNYRLTDIANQYNLDFSKIRFIKPVKFETNFITKYENNRNPFSRIMIGFNEDFEINSEHYPFDIFADVYPGSYQESPVNGTLYRTNPGNFFSLMNDYDLKVAYKLEDVPGKQHEISIVLTYEIFSDF